MAIVVAISVAGCAIGPGLSSPSVRVPAAWTRMPPSSGPDSPRAPRTDLRRWWTHLGDPTLTRLVDLALRANADLGAADARVKQARARAHSARAALLPQVGMAAGAALRPGVDASGETSPNTTFNAGIDASWDLDPFSVLRGRSKAALLDAEALDATYDNVRASLLADIGLVYVQVRTQQHRLRVATENLRVHREVEQLAAWRSTAGLVGEDDVLLARAQVAQVHATMASIGAALAEAEHRLDVLVGQPAGTLHAELQGGHALADPPIHIAIGIPSEALQQRADVRAAERALAAQGERLAAARGAAFPSLRLTGSIGLERLGRLAAGESGTFVYALLTDVTAPLFNAGRLAADIDAQDAACEEASAAYRKSILSALQDVEDALASLQQARDRAWALADAARAAADATTIARERYAAGLADFQAVLESQRSLLAFEDGLAAARGDGFIALIRLYKALGGGWESAAVPRPVSSPGAP